MRRASVEDGEAGESVAVMCSAAGSLSGAWSVLPLPFMRVHQSTRTVTTSLQPICRWCCRCCWSNTPTR